MNDAVPNHNGNGFPHMNDPNAATGMMDPSAFMANPGQFNPAQFANQQQQQQPQQGQHQPSQQQMAAMQQQQQQQNGPMRHASPSTFQQNPAYQTNPVIPSKRPRPHEDSVTGSPGQMQGMLPPSRSETPQQQNFPGMQQGGAMPQQTPGQFPHLQANGSANATPSPIMGNQMRPGSVPQRVATASPHPFSPGPQQQQQFTSQTSPAPSEHGTPQPNQFMQNTPQGYNPGFAPSPSNPRPSPNPNPNAMGANPMMQQQPQQPQQHMAQMPQGMSQMQANMYAQMQQQQQQGQGQQGQGQPGQQRQGSQGMQGMTEQQKMAAYQMRLQQQLQGNMQMQAQLQAQGMGRGMMQKPQMAGMPNGQMPQGGMRPQQRPMSGMNPEQFMKNLSHFMSAKGLPFDTNATVADRPVNIMMLFQAVSSKGGYKTVTAANGWAHIAQAIGLPAQMPTVAPALKQVYERNLQKFEEAWIAQQKTRMMGQNPNMPNQGTPQKPMQPGQQTPQGQMTPGQMPQGQMPQGQMTPGQMTPGQQQGQPQMPQQQPQQQHPQQHPQNQQQQMQQHQQQQHQLQQQQHQQMQQQMQQQHQQQQHHQQMQQQHQQTPVKPGQAPVNGFATPQPQQVGMMMGHQRNSLSKSVDPNTPSDPALQSPAHHRQGSMHIGHPDGRPAGPVSESRAPPAVPKSDDYSPCARELSSFGGIDLHAANYLGTELERWMPTAPTIGEYGNIDIAALTRGLECGLHSEARLALDTLVTVTSSNFHLNFRFCPDLLDALIDYAEEQLDLLVEHTVEVADEISLTSYEDVVRACRIDQNAVRDCPVFGTIEYDLDRAVDKLICITTIFRNTSFPGEQNENHAMLADETVIKFLCSVIRYLGTRTMLLRSHVNTLDFMKDIVVLMSNIAGSIELPSREQALCLLNFLLAFAPSPAPTVVAGSLFFAPFEPSVQPYLPHAVDALAKLLARDEPNRGFYKAIFGHDSGHSSNNDILTRTFALAISPLPDKLAETTRHAGYPSLIEVRKPFLMQGLLAAEILASLAPGFESGVAKAWLSSGEGLAQNLATLARELSITFERQIPRGPRSKDPELVYLVVLAVTLLRRLTEKARDPNHPSTSLPKGVLPSQQVLMEALSFTAAEWTKEGMLQQLSAIINMAR